MPEYLELPHGSGMKVLKPYADRDGKIEYHGRDQEKGEVVSIKVGYTKGGLSYMNGARIPRGIFVRLAEVTIEKDRSGFEMESFWIGAGRERGWGSRSQSYAVKALARGNPKLLQKVAAQVDPIALELADLFRHGYMEEVKTYLMDVALFAEAA